MGLTAKTTATQRLWPEGSAVGAGSLGDELDI